MMKTLIQVLQLSCLLLLCGLFACKPDKPEAAPGPGTPTGADTLTVADLDNFSDHLRFLRATKKPGKSPAAPGGSSLKISIKDTLRLVGGVHLPIKFLHTDTTKNVAGVYIQVHGMGNGGSLATNFYDVPELTQVSGSDTVSVVMVGFDPVGFGNPGGVPPAGTPPDVFDVVIKPYDESGQPLDEITVPVSVPELNDDRKGPTGSGECGLVNESGEWWEWVSSWIERDANGKLPFYSAPDVVYGGLQMIKGCCIDGESRYSAICLGDPEHERILPFHAPFQFISESLNFSDNGTFTRITLETHSYPAPDKSDFCSGKAGVVETPQHTLVNYLGNWTMGKVAVPSSLTSEFTTTTLDAVSLFTTSKFSSGGFGNSSGIIYLIDCELLILVQPDREGSDQHVFKLFNRQLPNDQDYYAM